MNSTRHIFIRQKGSALIVSLMILLVLTIIGVSSISGTNLEERMAHNFQHNTMAFQAAESAINNIIKSGTPTATNYDVDSDPLLTAASAGLNDTSTVIDYDLDPYDLLHNTTLSASATVVYQGEIGVLEDGNSLNDYSSLVFEVRSNASIGSSSATQTHVQGVSRLVHNMNK